MKKHRRKDVSLSASTVEAKIIQKHNMDSIININ